MADERFVTIGQVTGSVTLTTCDPHHGGLSRLARCTIEKELDIGSCPVQQETQESDQEWTSWRGPIATPSPEELADRYAASQLVKVYALGIDMRDLDTVLSVFTPDAMVEGMAGANPASEYLPGIYKGAAVYSATQHNITNQHVSIDGDEALVWSYAICYHLEAPGSGREDLIVATQYRDRCRRFENGWLITGRKSVMQWMRGPYPRSAS